MTETRSKKRLVDVPIKKLKPHPLQATLYRPRSEAEILELAADMNVNGLLEDVEITSDFEIISGNTRTQAAAHLGWKTIRCWIRADLADEDAIAQRLIETNLHRRQMSVMEMVRSYRHLLSIRSRVTGRRRSANRDRRDLRDKIAERFGYSGRTLSRWMQISELPLRIQAAVEADQVPMTVAVKVATMDRATVNTIVERLENGEGPVEVINEYVHRQHRQADSSAALGRVLKALQRGQFELAGRVKTIAGPAYDDTIRDLHQGRDLVDELIAHLQKLQRDRRRAFQKKKKKMGLVDADEEE
jgi:hypothetical protein